MTRRPVNRPGRRGHAGERGLTLVEMIVTIAIISVGVLGIAGGLAQSERIAGINQEQAELEVAMRQLSDFVRDSSPQGLGYVKCASPGAYNPHLPAAPSGVTWTVSTVLKSTSGTRTSATGSTASTPPLQSCGAGVGDWGVQQITLTVSTSARSLTRTVWKSISW